MEEVKAATKIKDEEVKSIKFMKSIVLNLSDRFNILQFLVPKNGDILSLLYIV